MSSILLQLAGDFGGPSWVSPCNSVHGEFLIETLSNHCRELGMYDQHTIAAAIFQEGDNSHARYWKTIVDGVLAGDDPRDRCDHPGCNALSTCSQGNGVNNCDDHGPPF